MGCVAWLFIPNTALWEVRGPWISLSGTTLSPHQKFKCVTSPKHFSFLVWKTVISCLLQLSWVSAHASNYLKKKSKCKLGKTVLHRVLLLKSQLGIIHSDPGTFSGYFLDFGMITPKLGEDILFVCSFKKEKQAYVPHPMTKLGLS